MTVTIMDSSGVDEVIISHSVDGGTVWSNQTMSTFQNDTWTVNIPDQPSGVTVMYKLYASDNYGNWAITSVFTYLVQEPTTIATSNLTSSTTSTSPPPTSPSPTGADMMIMVYIVGGVGVIVVVLVVIFLRKE